MYATPPVVDDILKENPDLMKKVMRSMRKRAHVCVNRNGSQVEGRGQ